MTIDDLIEKWEKEIIKEGVRYGSYEFGVNAALAECINDLKQLKEKEDA